MSKATGHDTTIVINGRERDYDEQEICFEKVVELAFGTVQNNNTTVYTVTYTRGKGQGGSKTLAAGQCTHVTPRMIFNVTATDKS